MPATTPDPIRAAVGRYAYACRRDVGTPETRAEAFRDLTALQLERAVRDAIAAPAPLTPEQRATLVALLMGR